MNAQDFYFGNDLSYANMMEDCGAVFKEKGVPKDVYHIYADHGNNLVRVRLWYNPTWQNSLSQPAGVKNQYNDFEDAKECIKRAKDAGMQTMLGIHYSDTWTDPGKQIIPYAWKGVANNLEAIKDSVYNYTIRVLNDLNKEGLMPEFVKVGNEANGGMLRQIGENTEVVPPKVNVDNNSWSRHAQLYQMAFKAIRDYSDTTTIKPKITVHFANPDKVDWEVSQLIGNGATDFDIIGFSYYYSWHSRSIPHMGSWIKQLKSKYSNYDVMVVETGYPWTNKNFDQLGNIIGTPDPNYIPLSPEKQLEYMVDFTKAVKENDGIGVIFWESAWVSTQCRNPWGRGSNHEDVAFFEVTSYNFMENGGGRWMEPQFYNSPENVVVTFKVDMTGQDVSKGVYITGSFTGETDWVIQPMYNAGNNIYTFTTAMLPGDTGAYYYLNDSSWDARETIPSQCAEMWNTDRKYSIGVKHTIIIEDWAACANISGVEKVKFERVENIPVYPNPNHGIFTIDFSDNIVVNKIEVFDVFGNILRTEEFLGLNTEYTLNIKYFAKGIYFVRLYTEKNCITKRMIYN